MREQNCNKLGAYMDGELDQKSQAEVQAHLETCPACREELEELQRVSKLLHASPQPDFTPAANFKAKLMVQLPRRDEAMAESAQPSSRLYPWMAPALVLAGWVFMQVTLALSTLVTLAGDAGMLNGAAWSAGSPLQMQWFTYAQVALSGMLSLRVPEGLKLLNDANVFTQNLVNLLLWQSAAALLFWAALALVWNGRANALRTQSVRE